MTHETGGGAGGLEDSGAPASYYYYHPWGWSSQAAHWALIFAHYQWKYGAREEDLFEIARQVREHASAQPHAVMKKPLTLDDYMASRYIVRPLHLFDICIVNDGAVCLIVRRADLARTCAVLEMLRPQPSEVLICADGCTDGTIEFLRTFHPKFRRLIHEPARGSIASADACTTRAMSSRTSRTSKRPGPSPVAASTSPMMTSSREALRSAISRLRRACGPTSPPSSARSRCPSTLVSGVRSSC